MNPLGDPIKSHVFSSQADVFKYERVFHEVVAASKKGKLWDFPSSHEQEHVAMSEKEYILVQTILKDLESDERHVFLRESRN